MNTDAADREAAETELANLPRESVLPVVLGKLNRRPAGPVYPAPESASADQDGPADWLAFYGLQRAVSAQTNKHPPEAGILLADLLARTEGSEARRLLADALRSDWADRAEPALAALFRDGGETSETRLAAAGTLLAHRRDRYYDEVRSVMLAAGRPFQRKLFMTLVGARPTAGRGIDPAVAVVGFELLQHDRNSRQEPSAGFSMALILERYLQVTFRPDTAAPRYHGAGDASDEFRRDTVDYAMRWWAANGPTLQTETAKLRPSPT